MIEGVLSAYSVGDYVTANCTSGKSNPPAALAWKINGDKVSFIVLLYLNILLHSQNIQSSMQPEFYFILIVPHVSATLGHHQVLLIKLSHCNFYIICYFRYALLFIFLMLRPTLLPFSTSPLVVFTILKILKTYVL
jgi:hypothetical protein